MKPDHLHITFLGTGTSMGVPMIGCDCAVCRSDDPRDRRLRASVWLQVNGSSIIVDAGIDFRQQALRAGISTVDAVLVTHHHVDHIFGLDDLRPINFREKKPVRLYATAECLQHIKRIYSYVFDGYPHKSDVPVLEPHLFGREPFRVRGITVTPIPLLHGDLPIVGFRIGDFAYCTDVSEILQESYPLLTDLQVLVLGALRQRPHPNHFTIDQAVAEARKIGARQTYLVHMGHTVSHRELEQKLPAHIQPAYDGLELEIPI